MDVQEICINPEVYLNNEVWIRAYITSMQNMIDKNLVS